MVIKLDHGKNLRGRDHALNPDQTFCETNADARSVCVSWPF